MKKLILFTLASFSVLLSGAVFANPVPVNFTPLLASVDFTTVISALMSIMASLAGVFIVIRGGSLVLSKIRR